MSTINNIFPNDIYNIDTMLFNLRERTGVESMIKSDKYFSNINNILYKSDDKAASIARAELDVDTFDLINSQEVPENSNKFKGDATSEYININIQRDLSTKTSASDLLLSINDSVGKSSADINKSHESMDEYMRNIIIATGKVSFNKSLNIIRNIAINDREIFNESQYTFANLSENKKNNLLDLIGNTVKSTLRKKITGKIKADLIYNSLSSTKPEQKRYIPVTYLDDLRIGNFKGPLYYSIRTESIKQTKLVKNVLNIQNINVQNYFIQQAIDLYIKTCYPVIIYDYIDIMMKLYIEYGDFVNYRIALLAKVMLTYYITKIIGELYSQSGNLSDANTKLLEQIKSNFGFYIQNINNIDMTYKDTNMMKTIVQNLHSTSSNVVDKNTELQTLKTDIKNNQLSLRNVLYNSNELKKQYTKKIVENIILVCLLITVLAVCVTLLMLQSETNKFQLYVIYIAGCVATILLIYYVIVIMTKLIKNSKKSS